MTQCTGNYNTEEVEALEGCRKVFFFFIASRASQTTLLIQKEATENSLIIVSLLFYYELSQGGIHFEICLPVITQNNPGECQHHIYFYPGLMVRVLP